MDKAIVLGFTQRIWAAASGLITLFLASRNFNDLDLGLFYAVFSIFNLIAFFDFGLNTYIIQNVAKRKNNENIISESSQNSILIYEAKIKIIRYWLIYSFLIILLIFIVGFFPVNILDKVLITIFFSTSAYLTLNSNIALSVMEGAGNVTRSSSLKLVGLIISSCVLWALIEKNYGYKALLVSSLSSSLFLWLAVKNKIIVHPSMQKIGFIGKEQLQLSLTNFSAYSTLQVPTLILTLTGNISAAGQMGMVFQIIGSITGFAIVFHNIKMFKYCEYWNLKNKHILKKFHKRQSNQSWCFLLTIFLVIFISYSLEINKVQIIIDRTQALDHIYQILLIVSLLHFSNKESILHQSKGGDPLYYTSVIRIIFTIILIVALKYYIPIDMISSIYTSYVIALFLISLFFILKKRKFFDES
jgi:O-antigen/teichoic acid export membrane protein